MIFHSFTEKANKSVNHAASIAMNLGHTYIGTEHLLAGLLKEVSSVAFQILINKNIAYKDIETKLIDTIGRGVKTKLNSEDFTPRSRRVLEKALLAAKQSDQAYVGTEHILASILEEENSLAVKCLKDMKVDIEETIEDCKFAYSGGIKPVQRYQKNNEQSDNKQARSKTPVLNKYGLDLTKKASAMGLDPVLSREQEIQKVVQILSRRQKNNPCLIGEPGVGKTAIIEGLATQIVSGNVPDSISNKTVISLDLTSMIAGAKYRGDFEDRLKNAIKELSKSKDIILFIDEIHTIIGAGAAEGAIDAANILKPYLARGEVQVIGATTLDEYRKHIEKDSALERRFQPVTIEEPSLEDTKVILEGLKQRYESHHKVEITTESIDAAVSLSNRYINDRFLPDKAIDLIDEAAAKLRLGVSAPSDEIKEQIEFLKQLEEEKAKAVNNQDFELAASIRDTEKEQEKQLEKMKESWGKENYDKKLKLLPCHIEEIVAEWTKIPLNQLQDEEQTKLLQLETIIHEKIIGQNSAVKSISKAIRRGRAGLKDPKRPIGSFLFLGPTGVGKTQLSKTLAEILFGTEESLIKLDMSEYMEKHAVSKLIGSPPGYVGYDQGGQLTEKIRRKPYAVVLFDEIEKAHPDVLNTLLQVLDDGVLTDSTGRKVDFKNTVIVMTSNVGAKEILSDNKQPLGFSGNRQRNTKEVEKTVMREVKEAFRPEFLNRIDEIIVFEQLGDKEIKLICKKMIDDVLKRLHELGIEAKVSAEVIDKIVKEEFDKNYGARTLKRAITTRLEDMLSEEILYQKISKGDEIIIESDGEKFTTSVL